MDGPAQNQGTNEDQGDSPQGKDAPQDPQCVILIDGSLLMDDPDEQAAKEIAQGLDNNDARALQRLKADAAMMDKDQFDRFLKMIDKYEQRGKGVDIVIGEDGNQFLTFPSVFIGENGRGRTALGTKERIPAQEADRKKEYGNAAQADGPVLRGDRPERTKLM